MKIVKDGYSYMIGTAAVFGVAAGACHFLGWNALIPGVSIVGVVLFGFMVFFFRDPERDVPADPKALVAGADGLIRAVEFMPESNYLKTETVRISIFLSPFNVHVNRTPMGGRITALAYTPGRHLLTIRNASSEVNEHSSILVENPQTRCLIRQIVGPIVRRVVYWLNLDQEVAKGERIGIMKFGSRLDVYFPRADVNVLVKKGDKVVAGVTVLAHLVKG